MKQKVYLRSNSQPTRRISEASHPGFRAGEKEREWEMVNRADMRGESSVRKMKRNSWRKRIMKLWIQSVGKTNFAVRLMSMSRYVSAFTNDNFLRRESVSYGIPPVISIRRTLNFN